MSPFGDYELVATLASSPIEVSRVREPATGAMRRLELLPANVDVEPYVVHQQVLARGEHEGRVWLAMADETAPSIEDELARRGRFGFPEATRVAIGIVDALGSGQIAASPLGTAHGALRSEVVHLAGSEVRVREIGVGALIAHGCDPGPVGPRLAPEQRRGEAATAASDAWAFALLVYEMLVGVPYDLAEETLAASTAARAQGVFLSMSFDRWFGALLDPDPSQRPTLSQAAAELIELEREENARLRILDRREQFAPTNYRDVGFSIDRDVGPTVCLSVARRDRPSERSKKIRTWLVGVAIGIVAALVAVFLLRR